MRLRLFFWIYAAANVGLLAYGVLALLNPNVLLESFETRMYQFPDSAVAAVRYLSGLFRLVGFFNMLLGMLGLILLWQYRSSRQGRALHIAIAVSLLSYLGPIVFDDTIGGIGVFEVIEHLLFAGMLISGFLVLTRRRQPERLSGQWVAIMK